MPASGRAHYRWSSGNGKVWRRRQTLGTVGSSGSNGKVWRLRQGLEVAARSGGSSKLWRRLKALDVVVSKLWRKRETLEMVEGSRCSGKQALEVVASFEGSNPVTSSCQANFSFLSSYPFFPSLFYHPPLGLLVMAISPYLVRPRTYEFAADLVMRYQLLVSACFLRPQIPADATLKNSAMRMVSSMRSQMPTIQPTLDLISYYGFS
jgi:hypothetical protein